MTLYVVYCPQAGYHASNPLRIVGDTGKRFRLESEAEHFVMQLRKGGFYAWLEQEEVRRGRPR